MAFIRNKSQGMQTAQPAYPVQSGMLGSSDTTGKKQGTQAGQPGGWTNIQDYLSANQGDNTNINFAKQRTGEKIQEGASKVAEQASNLTALPTANAFDAGKLQESLAKDTYDILGQGVNQSQAKQSLTALPTAEQEIQGYSPLEQGVADVNPNDFQSTMQFIGSLSPASPNYSAGQKSFDTMLLQGSPEFRQSFVPQMKEQYQTGYVAPLEQARQARTQAKTQAEQDITKAEQDWRSGLSGYLGSQERAINDILAQQQAQEAQASQMPSYEQWKQMFLAQNPDIRDVRQGYAGAQAGDWVLDRDYTSFLNRSGYTQPNRDTAISQYSSGNDINDYNALVNLLSGIGDNNYSQITNTGANYNPGSWSQTALPYQDIKKILNIME